MALAMTWQEWSFRILIFILSSLSVSSLLLYFQKIGSFAHLTMILLAVEAVGLVSVGALIRTKGLRDPLGRLLSGLWAGAIATLAYDLIRVPLAMLGIPVFKAISYFGMILLASESPTVLSETLGWAYHLSNGISFGLMYVALMPKPGPITAVLWGMTLEGVMLLTPYAEVFGYRRDVKFLAITIGAHAIYGLVLWLGWRLWRTPKYRLKISYLIAVCICVPLGLSVMAFDSYKRYGSALPPSPPPYIGPNLYTTWDVPEPDRIVAMWIFHRFAEPQATFRFIQPFDKIQYGTAFDLPEAEIRRHEIQSATEYLIEKQGLTGDAKLAALARMTHLNEVTPWMLASDPEAGQLTEMLRTQADQDCGKALSADCLQRLFAFLDRWYDEH